MSPDSAASDHRRLDMCDTTDTEVEDEYRRKHDLGKLGLIE